SLRYAYDRRPDAQFLLEALGRVWAAGAAPDWKAFRGDEHRLRVRLPTYPWERQRYWIEAPSATSSPASGPQGRRHDPAEWTYVPAWTRTPVPAAAGEERGRVLVLSAGPFGEGVAAALRSAGREVVLARAGDPFAADGFRPDVVVDARPVELDPGAAFGALLLLADALGGTGGELVVVTAAAFEVTGDEPLDPRAAALAGAAATLAHEYPSLSIRVVDVAAASDPSSKRVAAEVLAGGDEPVAAYRGRLRWARTFRPVRARHPAAAVREGGAYLLVGDAAGRNARFATVLAGTPGVRLALAAPSVPAELVRGLEAMGAGVLSLELDPSDAAALARAVAEAEARFGRIDGVVAAPELGEAAGLALASEADPAEWAAQVAGVERSLDALAAALEGRTPDFCLVESSLAGVLGVLGRLRHAAANALADAFAARRAREGGARWTSVAWDRWIADDEASADGSGVRDAEVPAALRAVLALAGDPVVLVSTVDLDERLRAGAAPPAPAPAAGGALYARPELESDYAPPTTELEEQLATLWKELLGIERVGIHDDFFELGGHSLLATQIISRVRALFRIDLRLAAIFEAPTVARMAELIEEAIIAELEALSDEDAAALVGR
ncbi:MAG TPA: KR domain-containing protein, partial [Longimicrobiaceae bacterium]|nr:KR domain-containing protein [Longimicrobiaceae bacterium]